MGKSKEEKRRNRLYNPASLEKAVEEVKNKTISLRGASKKYNIPKATISNHVNRTDIGKNGKETILSADDEADLVKWINACRNTEDPCTSKQILDAAGQLASLNQDPARHFKNGTPSRNWLHNFFERHPNLNIDTSSSIPQKSEFDESSHGMSSLNHFKEYFADKISGKFPVLNPEIEEEIANWIIGSQIRGESLVRNHVLAAAGRLALLNPDQRFHFKNDVHSRQWLRKFLQRYPQISFNKSSSETPQEVPEIKPEGEIIMRRISPKTRKEQTFTRGWVRSYLDSYIHKLKDESSGPVEVTSENLKQEESEDENFPENPQLDDPDIQEDSHLAMATVSVQSNIEDQLWDGLEMSIQHCRFCFADLNSFRNFVKINQKITEKFFKLTNIMLKTSGYLSTIICRDCHNRLDSSSSFQQKMILNQMKLQQDVADSEVDVHLDVHAVDPIEFFKIKEEPADVKDEVVVPETCVDQSFVDSYPLEMDQQQSEAENFENADEDAKEFSVVPLLQKNVSDVNRSIPWSSNRICEYCGKVLGDKRSFENHVESHIRKMTNSPCACDLCGFKTFNKKGMYNHMNVHKSVKYRCSFCAKEFNQSSSMRQHEKNAHSSSVRECKCECGKIFSSEFKLKSHKSLVHQIGPFPCPTCGKVFDNKGKMLRHKEIHYQNILCKVCGEHIRPSFFKTHMRSHQNERNYKCSFEGCTKAFNSSSNLSKHFNYCHVTQNSVPCPTCHAVFNNKGRLNIHIRRQHEQAKLPCEVPGCNHLSPRRAYLRMHYENHKNIDEHLRKELLKGFKKMKKLPNS